MIHLFCLSSLWVAQLSEEFEQRFRVMETSLSKFGMMLDSIQSDIMQANRGTKEVLLISEFYDLFSKNVPTNDI